MGIYIPAPIHKSVADDIWISFRLNFLDCIVKTQQKSVVVWTLSLCLWARKLDSSVTLVCVVIKDNMTIYKPEKAIGSIHTHPIKQTRNNRMSFSASLPTDEFIWTIMLLSIKNECRNLFLLSLIKVCLCKMLKTTFKNIQNCKTRC